MTVEDTLRADIRVLLEPGTMMIETKELAVQLSQAISLMRIADALEAMARPEVEEGEWIDWSGEHDKMREIAGGKLIPMALNPDTAIRYRCALGESGQTTAAMVQTWEHLPGNPGNITA